MSHGHRTTYCVRPLWPEGVFLLFALSVGASTLTFIRHDPVTALSVGAAMGVLGLVISWVIVRDWATVTISAQEVHVRTWLVDRRFPIGEVTRVLVHRAWKPLLPNEVDLVIRGFRRVTILRYIAFGRSSLAETKALAQNLGVPLMDGMGAQMRASRLAPLRWRARGDEWLYTLLCFVLPIAGLTTLAVAASLFGGIVLR